MTLESRDGLGYSKLNHVGLSWYSQMHIEVNKICNTATPIFRLKNAMHTKKYLFILKNYF